MTREELLAKLWEVIEHFSAAGMADSPAALHLLAHGADPDELSAAMRYAAYSGIFHVLMTMDEHALCSLPGLHESILSADPSGREGADFLYYSP